MLRCLDRGEGAVCGRVGEVMEIRIHSEELVDGCRFDGCGQGRAEPLLTLDFGAELLGVLKVALLTEMRDLGKRQSQGMCMGENKVFKKIMFVLNLRG